MDKVSTIGADINVTLIVRGHLRSIVGVSGGAGVRRGRASLVGEQTQLSGTYTRLLVRLWPILLGAIVAGCLIGWLAQ